MVQCSSSLGEEIKCIKGFPHSLPMATDMILGILLLSETDFISIS